MPIDTKVLVQSGSGCWLMRWNINETSIINAFTKKKVGRNLLSVRCLA